MAPRALPLKHLVKLADAAEPFATRAIQQVAQTLNPVVDAVNALEDAYPPTAHAATHEPGGTDVITGIAPGAHAVTHQPGGSDPMAVDAAAATGSLRTIGTTATSACAGNDARLSDARIPTGAAGGALTGTYPNPTLALSYGLRPDWAGVFHGSTGDGDPLRLLDATPVVGPSPTSITTILARCVKYRSKYDLALKRVRLFGINVTTGLYTFGLYEGTTLLADFGAQNSAANAWLAITTNLSIKADTDYWFCVSATGAGVTSGFISPEYPAYHSNFWKASAAPLGGRSIQLPEYAQFAVTAGVFPATLPTLAAAAYAGLGPSVPTAFFDSGTNDGT